VRGNDDWTENTVYKKIPLFSFSVGVHKIMSHFVVSPKFFFLVSALPPHIIAHVPNYLIFLSRLSSAS